MAWVVDGRVDGFGRTGGEGGMVIVRRAADVRTAVSSSATRRVMSIVNWCWPTNDVFVER